jgi:hypothetical protein
VATAELFAKSDPTPTLPCKQGREQSGRVRGSWALLLPLLAGGGWEGVKLLIFRRRATPAFPCEQGREHITLVANHLAILAHLGGAPVHVLRGIEHDRLVTTKVAGAGHDLVATLSQLRFHLRIEARFHFDRA